MASCRDCVVSRKFGSGIIDIMDQIYRDDMEWINYNPLRLKILKQLFRRKIITHLWWSFARIKFTKLGLKLYDRWNNISCNFHCAAKQFNREWTKGKNFKVTYTTECIMPDILTKDVMLVAHLGKNSTCSYACNLRTERSIWGTKYKYFYKNEEITKDDFEVRHAMYLLETS